MTTLASATAQAAAIKHKNRQTFWALLALLGAVLLWGTSYAATKTAITHFSPMLLIWLRMVMASLILLPFWRKLPKPDYRPGDAKWLLGLGLLQPCLYFLLEVQALHYSTSSQVGAVAALAGVFNVSVASGGDAYSVNVGQYNANPPPSDAKGPLAGRFVSRHAPSLRAIYDLGDPESSQFIYQTGQSGLALSARYADMSAEWVDGRYRKLQMQPRRWRHVLELQTGQGVNSYK